MRAARPFEISPAALGELEAVIARGPEMRAMLESIGEEIKTAAEQEADPIGHRAEGQGDGSPPYREAFGVALRPTGKLLAVVVYNDAYDAVWVELGTHPRGGSTPALGYHVLARALEKVMGPAAMRKVEKGLNSQRKGHK